MQDVSFLPVPMFWSPLLFSFIFTVRDRVVSYVCSNVNFSPFISPRPPMLILAHIDRVLIFSQEKNDRGLILAKYPRG